MPGIGKINFAGVKTEFEPLPDGIYESKFASYKFGTTKEKGEPKVDLQFAVTEEGDFTNRRTFRTCTFTPDSLWAFKRTMVALGSEADWEDPEGIDPEEICREVLNNKCLVKVQYDPEGKEDQVTHVKSPGNKVLDVQPTDVTKLRQQEAAQEPVATASGGRRR